MRQNGKKHRLTTRAILLFALLMIIAFSWYLINKEHESTSAQKDKEVSSILNAYKENKKDTTFPKPAVISVDSPAQVQKPTDTYSNTAAKIKRVKTEPGRVSLQGAQTVIQNTNVPEPAPAKTNDGVIEKNGKWKIIIKDDVLRVYPSQKWKDIIIVSPSVSGGKEKKRLFRPDFPGVVYISDTSSDIDVSGTKYHAVIEKFTAAEANTKMPFFISLKKHPEFIIFGDNEDLQNWYIYAKNQLLEYTPAMNPDNKQTFNFQ